MKTNPQPKERKSKILRAALSILLEVLGMSKDELERIYWEADEK